jgi:glycolate oxidase
MKNVVGYDLTRLFVGSEGTLGIVTRIILRLLPKPAGRKTMLVQFESIEGAAEAVSAIIRGRIIPATLEFLDKATIDCVRQGTGLDLPAACKAVLIIEVDGDPAQLDPQLARIEAIIMPLRVLSVRIAASHEESEEIWQVRRNVSPSLRKINPDKFNEDIVVPRSKVPEMIRALEKISGDYRVPIVNFGHAGDGNIHVNIMVNLQEHGMAEKVETVLDEVFRAAVALRGSISGEHGIGTAKAKYLSMELDATTISYMQLIKDAFDPNHILNPGKIFPDNCPQPPAKASGK